MTKSIRPTTSTESTRPGSIRVAVPHVSTRTWKTLEEVQAVFTAEELVQIAHRYCDQQDHAKSYRVKRNEEFKQLRQLRDRLMEEGTLEAEAGEE